MFLDRTLYIARKCGIKTALRTLLLSSLGKLDGKFRALWKPRISLVNGIPAIKSYIDLTLVNIENKIPILLPPLDSAFSREILYYKIREPLHVKYLYKFIESRDIRTVLDIGSNVGYFPLIELYAGAKKIIAIEPVEYTFTYLKLNLQNICPSCVLINAAVGTSNGKVSLFIPYDKRGQPILNWVSINRIQHNPQIDKIYESEIDLISINELVERYQPQLIRMDIEGAEWELLKALERIPSSLSAIDVETHDSDSHSIIETFEHLAGLGFRKVIVIKALGLFTIPKPLLYLSKMFGIESVVRPYCKVYTREHGCEHPFRTCVRELSLDSFIKIISEDVRRAYPLHLIIYR